MSKPGNAVRLVNVMQGLVKGGHPKPVWVAVTKKYPPSFKPLTPSHESMARSKQLLYLPGEKEKIKTTFADDEEKNVYLQISQLEHLQEGASLLTEKGLHPLDAYDIIFNSMIKGKMTQTHQNKLTRLLEALKYHAAARLLTLNLDGIKPEKGAFDYDLVSNDEPKRRRGRRNRSRDDDDDDYDEFGYENNSVKLDGDDEIPEIEDSEGEQETDDEILANANKRGESTNAELGEFFRPPPPPPPRSRK